MHSVHAIEFGTIVSVGRRRKDGKYPVAFTFKSSGSRVNKMLTQAQLDREVDRSRSDPSIEIRGYRIADLPRRTTAELDRDIDAYLARPDHDRGED